MINIEFTDKDTAYKYIFDYHYSNVMPRLNKYYLLIKEDKCPIGVMTLGWGTQPLGTIKKILPKHKFETKDYLEIGKMCFIPKVNNTNKGTQIMSAIIKFIKKNIPNVKFLYTLADGIMGKPGYIYQASNFKYIGSFTTLVYLNNNTGEKIHPRTAKILCEENAKYIGKDKVFWLTYDFMEYKNMSKIQGKMYRYIYPLDKQAKKILKEYNFNEKNPKKEDLKWYNMKYKHKEEIDMPNFNMNILDGYNKNNISNFKN